MPPPATEEAAPPVPVPSDRPKSPVHTAEVGENRLQVYFPLLTIQYAIHKKKQEMPPHSLIDAHAAMNAKYPDDRFDIWPRTAPGGEQEWRVKCLDCPGKVCDIL